jgi:general secretion pathway protein E
MEIEDRFVVPNLETFSQLLEPSSIVPAKDFLQSGKLIYAAVPTLEVVSKVRFILEQPVRFEFGSEDLVRQLIRHWRSLLSPQIGNAADNLVDIAFDEDEFLTDVNSEAPVIRLVNHLFARALDLDSSDIHFEPNEEFLDVRCRVDGIMVRIERLPIKAHASIASR